MVLGSAFAMSDAIDAAADDQLDEAQSVPVYQRYMNPILESLRALGGEAAIDDLSHHVVQTMAISDAVLAIPHNEEAGGQSEVFYRMGWSRTYLKKAGLLDNPRRAVWALTEKGVNCEEIDPYELSGQVQAGIDAESLEAELPPYLAEEILALHDRLLAKGVVRNQEELDQYYTIFRERFGPQVLEGLDGEPLLNAIHGRGTKDSLVYWLEFKDDDEMPALFGSIAGGSALKFGIYQSTETGHWMTGHPQSQERLTVSRAVDRAREQKKQMLAGAAVLAEFAKSLNDVDYSALQQRMNDAAPDLANTAWGHKYFSLLFPAVIDDYHAVDYQRFHLVKVHKLPTDGRYENARFFVGAARQLGIPVSSYASTLNHRNGSPHGYWRVGTSPGEHAPSEWQRMRDGDFIAIGWNELGDLSDTEPTKAGKDHVRALMDKHFPAKKGVVTRKANEVFKFVTRVKQGDIVVAMDGLTVKGIGAISGDYFFRRNDGAFAHRRPVRWLSIGEWRIPKSEALQTTFFQLGKHAVNLVEVERRVAQPDSLPPKRQPEKAKRKAAPPLSGVLARIQSVLRRKCQVILYGPPGTGKTYFAERAVRELAARSWFRSDYDSLDADDRARLANKQAIETCCFHPAYGYEDFLEGYRPTSDGGALLFERKDGMFKRLCNRAKADPEHHYFLLIDEINRGDVPRIFGELLTVLEKDKRGISVTLPLSGESFGVPDNVHVVATMNTADRSVALLDAALRRRFGFIELMPDTTVLARTSIGGLPLGPWLAELNRRVVRHAGRDARNLQIGHSYLLHAGAPVQDMGRFAEILRDDIIPLLEEYCYEDFDALEKILGRTIVLRDRQLIDDSLFEPRRHEDLMQALLTSFGDITATTGAVTAELDIGEEDQDESDDEQDPSEENDA